MKPIMLFVVAMAALLIFVIYLGIYSHKQINKEMKECHKAGGIPKIVHGTVLCFDPRSLRLPQK